MLSLFNYDFKFPVSVLGYILPETSEIVGNNIVYLYWENIITNLPQINIPCKSKYSYQKANLDIITIFIGVILFHIIVCL